jgi:MFS family permease
VASSTSQTSTVPRYLFYQGAASSVFYSPVFFVFYEERLGLTVTTILALQSYNTALRALLDLPFGVAADRWSRRGCMMASGACLFGACAALLGWPSFAAALLAETLMATATALRSGADAALLYDTLEAEGRRPLYAAVESRSQAVASAGSGAAAFVGGVLAAWDLRLPYAATALSALATLAAAASLAEGRHAVAVVTVPAARLRSALTLVRSSPSIRWAVALSVFAVVASHVYFYLQQPYLRAVGVPIAFFGFVFAATKAVTAVVASFAHRVDERVGEAGAAAVMGLVPALGLGAMAASSGPSAAAWILTRGLLDGLWMPLVNIYMNRRVDAEVRATLLSFQSVVSRLALSLALASFGLATSAFSLGVILAGAAAAAATGGALLALRRHGVREEWR